MKVIHKSLIILIFLLYFVCVADAAYFKGESSGIFINPTPENAVVSGVGTNHFTWGVGYNSPPSSLTFTGEKIDVEPGEIFSVGTLTFFNGMIYMGTEAETVDLKITISLTTPSGITKDFTYTLHLINTPNVGTPEENADKVFLPASFPKETFTVDGIEYTLSIIGFGQIDGNGYISTIGSFNVLEGESAKAQLFAIITCTGCKVPEGGPIREPIYGFRSCGEPGILEPLWGQFGRKQVLEADSGEKLMLKCVEANINYYALLYAPPGGEFSIVAMCPYEGGCNSGWFFHSGDNNNNGKPDCFIATRWISKDYGNFDDNKDCNLDWKEFKFDANSKKLSVWEIEYKYSSHHKKILNLVIPTITCPPKYKAEDEKLNEYIETDPFLGPETDEYFGRLIEELQKVPPGMLMSECPAPKDLDGDGDYDEADLELFYESLGSCRGDPKYNPIADADGSGCIDFIDENYYLKPDLLPPVIRSVILDTYVNIPNSTFHITVKATDNVEVVSVKADGIDLINTEDALWEGDIYIPEETPEGNYTLLITAEDGAGNEAKAEVEYSVVFPQGGFAVAVEPMMSSASANETKVYEIKIISNENFDDKIHVYISDEGIPDAYKANFSFNWTDKTIYLKSGETVELSLEVTIPQASGYKMFRVYADSMRFRTYGYCTGIVLIS